MATSLKTIAFPMPMLASITDATLTAFTQITVDLPESSKTFHKCWVEVMANDIITATGGTINEWRLAASVNGAAATTVTNTTDITHSGENMSPFISADFTAQFTANFSSTSHTFDLSVYLDQNTGTTLNFVSGTAILYVTYAYDDTSTTQVKNAWIPFTSSVGTWATSKGSANDTIPDIDTFLAHSSISYKHIMLIVEGNDAAEVATATDFTVSLQIDLVTAMVGNNHEASSLASSRYMREFFNCMSSGTPTFTTNATHSLYWWISTGAVTRMNHNTVLMLVVYTFDASTSNDGNISLLLPMDFDSPAGGTTSSDYQKGSRELWIEEPATITTQKSACRFHWEQVGVVATAYFRCGTQSFVSITDAAANMSGGNAHQITCDDNITFARGRNSLSADVYRSDTIDKMWNLSAMWIINYKCAKPSGGWGAANRTVLWSLTCMETAGASAEITIAATAPVIPETNYFISALGLWVKIMTYSTTTMYSYSAFVERLSAEGGVAWERVYANPTHDDPEAGLRMFFAQMRTFFKRFPEDADPSRMDIETSRRWRLYSGQNSAAYWAMQIMMTYHAITFTVSGTITGSGGGTVNLYLHKSQELSVSNKGELMQVSSRSGNGAYSFTVYDSTENVLVDAYEDGTHVGRSSRGLAS